MDHVVLIQSRGRGGEGWSEGDGSLGGRRGESDEERGKSETDRKAKKKAGRSRVKACET